MLLLGDHGRSVHERPQGLRVEIGRGAGIDVEIAGRRIHGALEQRPHGLLLQHVFFAMEIVHRVGCGPPPRFQALEERVEGEGRHTERKLPPGGGGRQGRGGGSGLSGPR